MAQPGIDRALNSEAWLDGDGRVAGDVACHRCGYNLRTLRPAGTCPECGALVQSSFDAARLLFADRRWLQGIVRGLDLVLLGALLLAAGGIAAVWVDRLHCPAAIVAWGDALPFLIVACPTMVIASGIWMLTRAEPGGHGDERRTTRRVVRIAGLVACVLYPVAPIIGKTDLGAWVMFYVWRSAVIVCGFAALSYGLWFAERMCAERLEGWLVALIVIYGLLAVGSGFVMALGAQQPGGSLRSTADLVFQMGTCCMCLIPPGLVLSGVMGLMTFGVAVACRVTLARRIRTALAVQPNA